MLKLKDIQTKPVIYQGLEVVVPVDTNFMRLRHTVNKLVLLASPEKPVWSVEQHNYLTPVNSSQVATLEHTNLSVEQLIDSLETAEDLPTEQDLEQLEVVENLISNLRSFANILERNVAKVALNETSENIQALLEHVYAEEGELDTFINSVIEEAEEYGISTGANRTEEDEDTDEEYEALLKFVKSVLS